MSQPQESEGLRAISLDEHSGDAHAKRTLPYSWNGSDFQKAPIPFFTKPFDRLIVTYTDSTKTVISNVVTKLSGVTQETVTNTVSATVDDFQRT